MIVPAVIVHHLRQLQIVQLFVHGLIIPLNGDQLVVGADGGKRVDHMCAEEGVHIGRCELARSWPVLGPVGNVAHQHGGTHCRETDRHVRAKFLVLLSYYFHIIVFKQIPHIGNEYQAPTHLQGEQHPQS